MAWHDITDPDYFEPNLQPRWVIGSGYVDFPSCAWSGSTWVPLQAGTEAFVSDWGLKPKAAIDNLLSSNYALPRIKKARLTVSIAETGSSSYWYTSEVGLYFFYEEPYDYYSNISIFFEQGADDEGIEQKISEAELPSDGVKYARHVSGVTCSKGAFEDYDIISVSKIEIEVVDITSNRWTSYIETMETNQ